MRKITPIIVFCFLILGGSNLQAQEIKSFSLQEALEYAMENNYDIMKSEKDIEAAKQQVKETTAFGLPQINAAVKYNDNIARPTMILPPEFSGGTGPAEVQFGTRYDMTASATATQLIFSGDYIVGLKAARRYLESTDVEFFRNKVAVKQQVANSYYAVLTTQKAMDIVDSTLTVTVSLAEETRQIYEVGFGEDIDVDQLDLLVADLEANKIYFENQLTLTFAYLKFYLALDSKDSIILTDNLEGLLLGLENSSLLSEEFDVKTNPDYYSLYKQKEIKELQVQLERVSYLPSINAYLNYQTQAQRDVWNFTSSEEKWYSSSIFGVSMDIPVFSSGSRRAKVNQAKIAYEQFDIMEDQLENQLYLQFDNFRSEYLNSFKVYENKDKNRKIAEKIFLKTTEKYKQGMASSLDILNTQTQFLNAESDYINAANAFLQSGEELKKILTKTIIN